MTKKEREEERRKEERQELIEKLKELIEEGDTIYGVLTYVSRDGMNRSVCLYVIKENTPILLDRWAGPLLQGQDYRHGGCKVSGVGMDVLFELVNDLSYVLFGDGYKLRSQWL